MRIVILNLPSDVDADTVRGLVGPAAHDDGVRLHSVALTGRACAVVQIDTDGRGASRAAQRLDHSHFRGARLQSWVPSMAWA